MEEMMILEAAERLYFGELSVQETAELEQLRRGNADIDQMVVSHMLFLQQMDKFAGRKAVKHQLHSIHHDLVTSGAINEQPEENFQTPIIRFWGRYKRTIAVAASIACVTALSISLLSSLLSPANKQQNTLQQLSKKINALEYRQNVQNQKIDEIISPKISGTQISGGTGFLIDPEGYLVTNLHVVNAATNLVVAAEGKEYIAKRVYTDEGNDIAILKIEDAEWTPRNALPYRFRRSGIELGEEIFTLGYPRSEIVYNKGYMSAASGYENDTLSVQIAISANPGNSGGPVFDSNGEIIGILSTRDKQANEVVFATKSIQIARAVEQLKEDTAFRKVKIPAGSNSGGMNRVQQIKKMKSCVFIVKGY